MNPNIFSEIYCLNLVFITDDVRILSYISTSAKSQIKKQQSYLRSNLIFSH